MLKICKDVNGTFWGAYYASIDEKFIADMGRELALDYAGVPETITEYMVEDAINESYLEDIKITRLDNPAMVRSLYDEIYEYIDEYLTLNGDMEYDDESIEHYGSVQTY